MYSIKCPICGIGGLDFSIKETLDSYIDLFELEDVNNIVDGVISNFFCYKCLNCGAVIHLTFEEIEKSLRKDISKKVIDLKAKKEISNEIPRKINFYIYCGGCSGFDGNGSCPDFIYDNCKLRKIPNVL